MRDLSRDSEGSEFGPDELADAIVDAATRFCALIQLVGDPSATSPQTPDWTAAELIHHVTTFPVHFDELMDGNASFAPTALDLGDLNASNLAYLAEASLADCEATIREGIGSFADRVRQSPVGDGPIMYHGTTPMTIRQLAGFCIGEHEMHGIDLAAVVNRKWTIPAPSAAAFLHAGVSTTLPNWIDPAAAKDHCGRYEILLRGGLGRLRVHFDDGRVVEPDEPWKPETRLVADAPTLMRIIYGRQSQWSAIARGQLLAYGQRPWRALTLASKILPI